MGIRDVLVLLIVLCGACSGSCGGKQGKPTANGDAGVAAARSSPKQRISCNINHQCALDKNGAARCWGDAALVADTPDGSFVSISAGRFATCALRADQTATCWGQKGGAGTQAPPGKFVSVQAGAGGSCGLRPDQTVSCWTYPGSTDSDAPEEPMHALTVAGETTCGLTAAGKPVCWGFDPTRGKGWPEDHPVESLAVGWLALCGIDEAGQVTCSGENTEPSPFNEPMAAIFAHPRGGICGLTRAGRNARCFGFDERANIPESVDGPFRHLYVAQFGACGLRQDGALQCFRSSPSQPPAGSFEEAAFCGDRLCGLAADGSVTCTGHPYYGQTRAPDGSFAAVAAGRYHSCAIGADDGKLVCWGGPADEPYPIADGRFESLDMGDRWGCGIASGGKVTCWGDPQQLAQPPSGSRFVSIDLDSRVGLACGVTRAGRVRCWGKSGPGPDVTAIRDAAGVQVGHGQVVVRRKDGTLVCRGLYTPSGGGGAPAMQWREAPCPADKATAIALGDTHTCWVDEAQVLHCLSADPHSAGPATEPAVTAPGPFRQIVAGHDEVCAITRDGSLECWGGGGWGETHPPAGRFTQVSPGWDHVCALDSRGAVHCWGGYAGNKL